MDLHGTTALVTGAARRVGRAVALELARGGCDVAIQYRTSHEDAARVADAIHSLGRRCCLIRADLSVPGEWSRIVQEAVDGLGSPGVLVNNASVFEPMALDEFDADRWERTFRVNLTAVAGLCHYAAPHLSRLQGKIVNLADISADRPWSGHLAYCASKAALINLTRALARSLAPDVQVNAVSPGIAEFPESYDAETRAELIAKVPLKRAGSPDDIARVVRYLCEHGDYVTGQVINVDGGRSIV